MGCDMLKPKRDILVFLALAILYSFTAVAILVMADGGGGTPVPEIFGSVTYAGWCNPSTVDSVILQDSLGQGRLAGVPIQGGGSKFWYNGLTPSAPGHYYVVGIGLNCCSEGYYIYWNEDRVNQDVVMDQHNYVEGGGE
jgi:hypothetical protein